MAVERDSGFSAIATRHKTLDTFIPTVDTASRTPQRSTIGAFCVARRVLYLFVVATLPVVLLALRSHLHIYRYHAICAYTLLCCYPLLPGAWK